MKYNSIQFLILFFCLSLQSSDSHSRNLSNVVEQLVLANLMNDDYAELLPNAEPRTVIRTREVSTVNGMNAKRVGDVVHFFIDDRIVRFDMATEGWLSDVSMISPFTSSFMPTQTDVYVTHNLELYKYDFLGNPPVLIHTFASEINEMVLVGDFLMVVNQQSERFTTFDLATNVLVDQYDSFWHVVGLTASPGSMKVFGRSAGVSPSDIRIMIVNGDGTIQDGGDSPYHGDYPTANKVYAFPNGSRVVDSSGIIYFTADLTYSGSLAGPVDHIDFYADLPVILRGSTLHAYSNVFHETGIYELSESKDMFFIKDDKIHLFDYNITTIGHETVNISEFGQLEPGQPVNPVGLAYDPDAIEYDGADNLFILSRNNLTIFNYNLSSQSYEDGFALLDPPLFISYSPVHQVIYVAYSDGRVSKIDPSDGYESPFITSPQMPCGLEAAGNYVFVCDPSGAWVSHFTYHKTGVLISQEEWSSRSNDYVWSQQNRSIYYYRDDTSPNDLIKRAIGLNGVLGDDIDSPYHGGVGTLHPICVNPNGLDVFLGSGQRYDALDLTRFDDELSNQITACAWSRGELYTLENSQDTNLQKWSIDLIPSVEGSWTGSPIELLSLSSNALVVIHDEAGIPQFRMHNDEIFKSGLE